MESLSNLFHSNIILSGGIALAISSWVVSQLRTQIANVWNKLLGLFKVDLTIWSDETDIFNPIDKWLAELEQTSRIRSLVLRKFYDRKTEEYLWKFSPGEGTHLFIQDCKLFWVRRTISEDKSANINLSYNASNLRRQIITITSLGRSRTFIENIVKTVSKKEKELPGVKIYYWQGNEFQFAGRKNIRSLDTIYMEKNSKERLVKEIESFFSSEKDYSRKGIPWKYGVKLEGPPGTGKTSLIFALASHFKKSIYVISPSSITSDEAFLKAMNSAGNSFILLEDIDSIKAAEVRQNLKKEVGDRPLGFLDGFGLTLSGLLNAVDGVCSRDGRVLFITTNTPEVLDPALIRPGRIDLSVTMDLADQNIAQQMWNNFFPQINSKEFFSKIKFPVSQAELQCKMLQLEKKQV